MGRYNFFVLNINKRMKNLKTRNIENIKEMLVLNKRVGRQILRRHNLCMAPKALLLLLSSRPNVQRLRDGYVP